MSYHDQLCFDLNDGNKMPAVGYGTWKAMDTDLEKALNKALEVGYRHIDTAAFYSNEHVIGAVLEEWFTAGKLNREDIYVVTKLPAPAMKASLVEKYLQESLDKLKLEYVDMYLIHSPIGFVESDELVPKDDDGRILFDHSTDHIAIWKAMEDQVDAGRTKSIGLSNFNKRQIERIITNARIPPANLQIELHVYFQQKDMAEFCRENDILITSYSSLGTPGTATLMGLKEPPNPMEDPVVLEIASKYGKSAAQVILKFIVQLGFVVIPKSISEKRIEENFQIFDFELEEEDVNKLKELDRGEECRILILNKFFLGAENHPEYPFPYVICH